MEDPIVILSSARTPIGSFQGILSNFKAPQLGAFAIEAAVQRSGIDPSDIDEVIMGCVLSAGLGQAPARQASLGAGLPRSANCTTINKVCGSGMKAVMLAHDLLLAGNHISFIAGGMESMTNAPYILDKARSGYRLGHGQIKDHLFLDGLEDAYETGKLMGIFAERTAEKFNLSRKMQDEYALISLSRALEARDKGWFLNEVEITPIPFKVSKTETNMIMQDEQPSHGKPDKIASLKPVFKDNGTVTAANSSSISDGAAALHLMRLSEANKKGLKPLAKILAHTTFAHEPEWFTTAPITAIKKLLERLNWSVDTPDLYEINEAFAVVALAAMHTLNIPHEKLNIHGGACALGHPLGATGTRIITTLLGGLIRLDKQRGIAALCLGGGEATAIAIERMEK